VFQANFFLGDRIMSSFFESLKNIKKKADSGELKGFAVWPLQGEATLTRVGTEYKMGKPYLSFGLISQRQGSADFLVRVPLDSDKDAAKIMGLQRIYSTLFAAGNFDITRYDPEMALKELQTKLPLKVNYSLQEYEQVSSKNGQTYKNQSLESLEPVVTGNDLDWGV